TLPAKGALLSSPRDDSTTDGATRWLLLAAMAALAGEWWLRRRQTAMGEAARAERAAERARAAA
ncbi:MAG: hypothetical protein ABIT38_11225, partial [Gemmatimonadaceae bacterium]